MAIWRSVGGVIVHSICCKSFMIRASWQGPLAARTCAPDITKGDATRTLIVCTKCQTIRMDLQTTYLEADSRYVARRMNCYGCQKMSPNKRSTKTLVPVDKAVPYITNWQMTQLED